MLFFSKQKSAVLLFHRVTDVRDRMWDPMSPELFVQTLKYVKKNFHTVALSELLFEPSIKSTKPLAAITFDDGYRDFLDISLPLLEKYSLPASMFIVTDCIDKNIPTWTYVIDYLFENTRNLKIKNFDFPEIISSFQKTEWSTIEERINYGKRFKQYLKSVSATTRGAIIDNLLLNFNDVQSPSGMMLSWDDIKQIKSAGFEIGSHSVTHTTLDTVEDDGELSDELINSKNTIRVRAGIEAEIFSYPCGNYDDRVKTFTEEAGYKAGLAVDRKLYNKEKDGLFEIPRIELYNEGWVKTKLRVDGAISFVEKYLRR